MAVVRYVSFFPPTGPWDRRWIGDRACDLLVRSGRRVAELYSEEVLRARLVGPSSEIRIYAQAAPRSHRDVSVDVHRDHTGGPEIAVALIPRQVERLDPEERADLTFRIFAGVVRALARHRHWSEDDLDSVEAAVRGRGLEFMWHGPWKASPDRRHEARGTFWLEDDGFGRGVIEVRERGHEGAEVTSSRPATAYCTGAGFERSARTLRWKGENVTMVASVDFLGRADGLIQYDAADRGTVTALGRRPSAPSESRALPTIEIETSGRIPDAHAITFIGGGPSNGVPYTYLHALERRLKTLGTSGLDWWSGADRRLLQISYTITDTDQGVVVRRLREHVTASINRPLAALTPAQRERRCARRCRRADRRCLEAHVSDREATDLVARLGAVDVA